ncbi:MAG: nucleotidyltransferase family protein [Betaproteobacteria bacterium]|nr:nucleotidyltransferase family protein [Betaproteobacteria bacterium]
MILAAGRGERMRPLTDETPKALLRAGGRTLIEHHLENLRRAGVEDVVINHAHLGHRIEAAVGDGGRYALRIHYSPEPVALETAGGIANALPILGQGAFLVVNADVYCDLEFSGLLARAAPRLQPSPGTLAYLVLVDNPDHHADGDFALHGDEVLATGGARLTFSGIGIYRSELFGGIPRGQKARLGALLKTAADAGRVRGEHYRGRWCDVGTPERLARLDRELATGA